jgi:outer membrane protein assembly factor BamB
MKRAVLALLLPLAVLAADPWSQWRGPARDGQLAGFVAPAAWPAELKTVWKVPVGEGHASPVAGGGKLYLFSREGEQEVLRALDPASGKELWKAGYKAPYSMNLAARSHGKGPKSTPLFHNGRVYTLGISGIVTAWDAATGQQKWQKSFGAPDFGSATSPVLHDGLLILHIAYPNKDDQGSLTAFDAESGQIKWQWGGDGAAYTSPIVADLNGTAQVITQSRESFVGVDAKTGQLLWKIPFKTPYHQNSVTPLFKDGVIYYSGLDHGVAALRPTKKSNVWAADQVWRNDPREASFYMNTPVLLGNVLVGFSHRNRGQMVGLDAASGKLLWAAKARQGENASLVASGGLVFVLTNDAELIIGRAPAQGFEELKRYTVASSPTWAHPLVTDQGIFIKDKTDLALLTWK